MAISSGTATNYLDLLAKLRDFLKTGLGGQNWTQVGGPTGALAADDEVTLRGPGLAGADEILVGIKAVRDTDNDIHNWQMYGLVSFNPALALADQVNSSLHRDLSLWNNTIPYWIVANGRRFILIAKVSSIYQSAYGGFILPYCDPTAWVYPHFMGATNNQGFRWSVNNNSRHSAFFNPGEMGSALCFPDTVWENVRNRAGPEQTPFVTEDCFVNPWGSGKDFIRDQLDGGYTLEPAELFSTARFRGTLGVLEGVYRVSGFSNASESNIVIGGVTYKVFQNVYRTDNNAFCAIRMT